MQYGYSSSGRMGPPPGHMGPPPGFMGPPPGHMGPPPGFMGPPPGSMGPHYGQLSNEQAMAGMQQNVVVNHGLPQSVPVATGDQLLSSPVTILCPDCKVTVTTNVKKSINCCNCVFCIFSLGIFWACHQCCKHKSMHCCDATHQCPTCGKVFGIYSAC